MSEEKELFSKTNYSIRLYANQTIIIPGKDGLRTLLNIIANCWSDGQGLVLKGTVKFVPLDNKPEYIYCEVLDVESKRPD